jgi:drug/metabolite transporter (DMT)-like permease
MLAGGVVLMTAALITYSPSQLNPAQYSARSLFGLAYLIVAGSVVGYSAYAWLLANAPIGQVSTYAYVNPVIAIALGAIVLGESVTWRIVGGALLIIAAVAIVVRRESAPAKALEPDEIVRADRDPIQVSARRVAER